MGDFGLGSILVDERTLGEEKGCTPWLAPIGDCKFIAKVEIREKNGALA